MNITIRKIGNSEGIIIPKDMLDQMGLKAGDSVQAELTDGKLQLTTEPTSLSRQLAAARVGMEKYRVALRELAK